MTIRYHCDGPDCDKQMEPREPRLAIKVENGPPDEITHELDPDMDPEVIALELQVDFDAMFTGDFHFCSEPCLTGWAFARSLEEK